MKTGMKQGLNFGGYYTALITPFKSGKIDGKALENLVEWQINSKIHGLVPCGTTGETPSLSDDEYFYVIDLCIKVASGKVPIIPGVGSNSTAHAIDLTKAALKRGATAGLSIVPYYNKPNQEGVYQHFKAINDAVDLPLIVYNHPGRTGVSLTSDTLVRLAALPNIIGVKNSDTDISMPLDIAYKLEGRPFIQFTGNDEMAPAAFAHGCDGCISVASNIAPEACVALYEAWKRQDINSFVQMRDRLYPLFKALSCDINPVPAKYIAAKMGFGDGSVRLPLVDMTETTRKYLDNLLDKIDLEIRPIRAVK